MNRRRLLLAVGSSGSALLAGCVGGGDSSDGDTTGGEPTDTDTPTAASTPDEAAVAEQIESAGTDIQAAIDMLVEAIENDDQQLDGATFHQHLEAAEDELADTDSIATDEQLDQVRDLRDFIEVLSLRGDAEITVNAAFDEELSTGLDAYWAGRDHYFQEEVGVSALEQASDQFGTAEQTFTGAETTFTDARELAVEAEDLLGGITPDVVDAFENIAYADLQGDVSGFTNVAGELAAFSVGIAEGSRGWAHVSEGFISVREEAWGEATETFESAESTFESAVETLEDVALDDLQFLMGFFSEVLCEIGESPEAAGHWITAAEAGQEGDQQTHEAEIQAGWELMASCHEN